MAKLEQNGVDLTGADGIGCSPDGRSIRFQLVDAKQRRRAYSAPYEVMGRVLFALQAAMGMASARRAGQPGFDPAEIGPRLAVRAFATGQAVAHGEATRVAVRIDSDLGTPVHFLMTPESANLLAAKLKEASAAAPQTPPLRRS